MFYISFLNMTGKTKHLEVILLYLSCKYNFCPCLEKNYIQRGILYSNQA